ncbi:MAG TPA: hypothetical protein P5567_01600 [Kiritimatiellia bacterium]|nr:hypothetical protein [Kiritimatiellia bacterium]
MIGRRVSSWAALLGALLGAGCVSEPPRETPADELTYTAVRTEERVLLSWESQPGEKYTILYSENRRPPWQPLPNAINLVGTGRTITVEDRVTGGRNRYYRVQRGPFPPAPPPRRR